MRAVRYHDYGAPDVLGVDEIDCPMPGPDEVLLQVAAASVNPVDVMFRTGEYEQVPLPSVPGGDAAGVVDAVGGDVEDVDVGDRVFCSGMDRAVGGTFAEYAAVPTSKVARLPEEVSFEEGAAVANVGATAWTALETVAGIQAGDRVLVHGGAGGVGHVAVQLAACAGAEVIATAGSATARDRLRELGAATTLDYASDSLARDVEAATSGAGVEVVLDHRLQEYLALDLEVLAEGGQVVSLMGHVPATSGIPLYTKEATIQGLRMDSRPNRRPVLCRLRRLLNRGALRPVVAREFSLSAVADAHRAVTEGGYVGKLVVKP